MTRKFLPFSTAVAGMVLLGASLALAQTVPAKPSPYQGVSRPPADDILVTDDEPAAQPAASLTSRPAASSPGSAAVAADAPSSLLKTTAAPPANPGAEIVTYAPGPANALPEGTVFRVSMLDEVMASDTVPGTPFHAKLSQDLKYDGRVVVPVGSELLGKVAYASSGRRIAGPSLIHLVPSEFILPDGTRYRVHAEVIDTAGSDTKATGEGNITGAGHRKRTAVELAAGAGGGALVGSLGGPAGAAIGSAVGAGVMGARWLLANQSAEIPEHSTVVFSLTDPMFLTPARN